MFKNNQTNTYIFELNIYVIKAGVDTITINAYNIREQ